MGSKFSLTKQRPKRHRDRAFIAAVMASIETKFEQGAVASAADYSDEAATRLQLAAALRRRRKQRCVAIRAESLGGLS